MIRSLSFAAFATAALASSSVFAQGTSEKKGVSDSLFAVTAADGGLTEVLFAQMGVQKATDPELKKFSEHMVEEHTKVNNQLKELAAKKGMALPTTITPGHQFCAQNLAGLSGKDFDCAYALSQLLLHMDTIAVFEAEAERGQDADIKAFAAKTLPHIKGHTKDLKPIAMRYEKEKMEKEEKMEKSAH